ncbi:MULTISPECIES: enoyl-CoA hydratase-related protein [unclassified Bradyrhizobium]|uniref:enoyl-CoA hydratase-related protein n=1 Tax=unclassified Bradyrhizobium TaxID=2631580 RepID=UPI00201BEA67|nr:MULTISPECIES: enoyl-CoA hydratase-related protein [unclassified Bradyrhizobium]MCA1378629.1 enoyl-CoA hydratase/isomerase family protein [Bradyrhizobium sp. IC4060]MCA1488790.1 enoyl-CoA hydratase/isomerase family protein [Bradyrhizobium sp. IC4061]
MQRAKWLILSAAAISASLARDWGIVTELSGDLDLIDVAEQMAMALTRADSETVATVKGLISDGSEHPLTACLEGEITALERRYDAASFQNGIRNFLERKSRS